MDIFEIECEYDVKIKEEEEWKYVAYCWNGYLKEYLEVAYADTLEYLIMELDLYTDLNSYDDEDDDEEMSDSDWARSIDFGGYDTEDEFWEHLYKF